MAISQAQPLLLLFVSLFFLPAALGTVIDFYKTRVTNNDVMNVTKVEIIPYPIKFQDKPILKITGVTSQNLTEADFEWNFLSLNGGGYRHQGSEICRFTKCPMEPGPFVLTLANIVGWGDDYHQFGEYRVYLAAGEPEGDLPLDEVAVVPFHASALAKFTNVPPTNSFSVTRVEILPYKVTVNDNPVFRITANTPKNISSSSLVSAKMILEGSGQGNLFSRRNYRICDTSYHCPIKPGRFVLALANPYWMYEMKAGTYRVDVQIVNPIFPFNISMSVVFWFQVSKA